MKNIHLSKNHFYFSFFFFFLFLLSSCNKENKLQKEREIFKKTYYLSSDTTNGQLKVELDIEFLVGYNDTVVLQKIQKQILENYLFLSPLSPISSNREVLESYAETLAKEYIENNQDDFLQEKKAGESSFPLFLYDHEYTLKAYFLPEVKSVFSYCLEYFSYAGGAHGIQSITYSNYDLKSGDLITEEDLFLPESKERLTELLREQLVIGNEYVDTIDDLDERFWIEKIEPNGNFYITEQGINYTYNPYEIAPYFMGAIEVNLPFHQLKSIIKKNSPIKNLL